MLSCGWLGRAKQQPMIEQATGRLWVLGPIPLALFVSWALLLLLRPRLCRYVMGRPRARSSHEQPRPQGGSIAVVAGRLASVWSTLSRALLSNPSDELLRV